MRKGNLDQTLERMVRRLVKEFDPDQIILFGSHARGTAHAYSDVDLLVVLPFRGSKRAKQVEMRVALHDIHVPKDVLVATPDEVARHRNVVGTIIYPALREGKVLYARPCATASPSDWASHRRRKLLGRSWRVKSWWGRSATRAQPGRAVRVRARSSRTSRNIEFDNRLGMC